ncbi:hypothetical protein [Orenia marismortui]|uniref:Uncharacterized protein n=1 Tax=Orenia marismortui TaxID=46469 RepID=A0A4R8GY95_9FIRM|nr:hypothetical protein [Orenia marismortui]TDX48831.1 hypothetical protein C7959_12510 [Orenia marismortui]
MCNQQNSDKDNKKRTLIGNKKTKKDITKIQKLEEKLESATKDND